MSIKQNIKKIVPQGLFNKVELMYYRYQLISSKLKWKLCGKKVSAYDIPIVINNYNRLEYLEKLINSLKSRGYNNIHILDNDSTYPPLLEFYKTTDANVIYLGKNWGFRAIWESGIVKKFWNTFYVYTDSDMEIDKDCPSDFMEYLLNLLDRYPKCFKVGFGLRIDDLPSSFIHKEKVISHENQFWKKELEKGIYDATIDTTFALYRPYTGTSANSKKMNIRTGAPYIIRHLPWYIDSADLTPEEQFYVDTITKSTHWSVINKTSK